MNKFLLLVLILLVFVSVCNATTYVYLDKNTDTILFDTWVEVGEKIGDFKLYARETGCWQNQNSFYGTVGISYYKEF